MSAKNIKNKVETVPKKSNLWKLYVFIFAVMVLWWLSMFYIDFRFLDSTEKGLFGDSFGAVNSLFSGLAFAGIIYTILLQRKELEYQRQELIETKIVLKESASAQDKSQKALTKQIENMNLAAKLDAHSSLMNFYLQVRGTFRINEKLMDGKDIAGVHAVAIEDLLKEIEQVEK